jgi:hypothetical protein
MRVSPIRFAERIASFNPEPTATAFVRARAKSWLSRRKQPRRRRWLRVKRSVFCELSFALAVSTILYAAALFAAEPPALNPFGPATSEGQTERDDAVPGCLELSDGSVHPGMIYLTRDARLKVYDEKLERQREVPLQAIKQIDCKVKKEWLEKEWKFKETTSDEKIFTGRSYPAREYLHTITLRSGRTITCPLAAIVYVQASPQQEAERFLLNKRNKGEAGKTLKSLVYVKRIKLGEDALEDGKKKVEAGRRGVKSQADRAKPQAAAKNRASQIPNP